MDAETQVVWHFVSRHLEPIMEAHYAELQAAHGDEWWSKVDPWKLVLPCMEKTVSVVRSLDAMDDDVREEVTAHVLSTNARMRELLRPGIEDALAGRVVPGEQVILLMREQHSNRT